MLFNSYEFIFLYFPIVVFVFFGIAKKNYWLAALWLALASLFFYGWWNPQFVLLLTISVLFNYSVGLSVSKLRTYKNSSAFIITFFGISLNLFLLIYYKYFNFFIQSVNEVSGSRFQFEDIVLPLGISFFTFTQIAFLVDTYKGIVKEYNFGHYLLFVTYFPHLIAGPVLHHKQMMPQFSKSETYTPNWENIGIGLTFFSIGLAKKVLIADSFSDYASPVFNLSAKGIETSLFTSWVGALAFTFQLYFDFSGYSDMAIGLAKIMGIDLPNNFNSPYKAQNIIEFWRRWHITLSNFLRDYLYIPLGGSRKGTFRRHINLFVTMLLGGLWHGSNWTFVIWGGLHGMFLIVNHIWNFLRPNATSRLWSSSSTLLTFICVVFAWVFFRSESVTSAISLTKGMLGLNGVSFPASLSPYSELFSELIPNASFSGITPELASPISLTSFPLLIVVPLIFVWILPNTQEVVSRIQKSKGSMNAAAGIFVGGLFTASVLSISKVSEFLYFQF